MTHARRGYEHRLLLHGSDAELVDVGVPFLEEGLRMGEASVVATGSHLSQMLRQALPSSSQVIFDLEYSRPIPMIESRRRMVSALIGEGARAVRMLGEVPHPGIGQQHWGPWAQYEAAINELYADLPLTGLCVYDRRTIPDDVLADVLAAHPLVVDGDGVPEPHDRFMAPRRFLRSQAAQPDPLESREPTVALRGVTEPRHLRRDVQRAAGDLDLSGPVVDDFVLAVNEVASDALHGGRSPLTVRVWLTAERLVAQVGHPRPGPDPLAGFLLPSERENGALQLPIARRFSRRVDIRPGPDCLIRLVSYPDEYASGDDRPLTGVHTTSRTT